MERRTEIRLSEKEVKEAVARYIEQETGKPVDRGTVMLDFKGGYTVFGQFDRETSVPAVFNFATAQLL